MKSKTPKASAATCAYMIALLLVALRWGDLRIARLREFNRRLSRRNDELRREIERLQKESA